MSTNNEEELNDAIINEFTAAGYTTDQINTILDRQHWLKHEPERPTWIKVHRKYLLPDTLVAYRLPWDWDEFDSNFIMIKEWISEDFQEELFAHTRRLREGKEDGDLKGPTELKVNDRNKDNMYLVRKKEPGRRHWIFT